MKLFRPCIFWAIFFLFVLSFQQINSTDFLSVTKFVDGNTFWIINSKGQEEKIRSIRFNTPEVRNTSRTQIGYFGIKSSDFAKKILDGKSVKHEYDVQKYDQFKRTLASVYLEDGIFFNALLVKEGYATVATYPPNVNYLKLFTKLAQEARENNKGLWAK